MSSRVTPSSDARARMAAGYAPWVGFAVPSSAKRRRSTGVIRTGSARRARAPSTYWRRYAW